ncbi:von Willebrand factor type A domain containing protein [Trichomonas vaginalis G3]|uniref:von Willebrand factor type A domain containing protein n=1 Tax=Trichomonas vaginalis (strain ATCC PRA-98 / G3) TaxID=412133 RepID=A2F9Z5_TRIV3|nr:von Willebrand factor A domain-containing protein 5A family [Trichomonas vaginalis G3]EAX98262.1 von Willebrand factor type A domain containing protein [Trichomonas vaginalis G3]KAI5511188.1 von Willebrand factor A domain-containing protein 5A family [Trichomonas vaginalis G3]|eukprot:XP_001311192.1 von Willebrand factor type A domain containing protein [Trichomonas vaginalis G3]
MIGRIVIPDREKKLTYSSVSIDGIQQDTFLSYTIKQVFTNTTGKNTDITYFFPNEPQFCTYDSLFIVDGKEIKPQLRVKEEAKKEFDEAKEAGHHAMLGEDIGNGLSSFQLGNLPAGKTAEIHLKVSFLADLNENGYFYKFPLTHKYQKGSVTNDYSDKPETFHFATTIKTQKEIQDVKVSVQGNKNLNDPHNATFVTNEAPTKDAIIIEAQIKDEDKNVAVSSDGYIAVTTYPFFEGSIESNSEFYFVVDCSGSMAGKRIENAVKCMRLFIQSLPVGCRFAILKFGSQFQTVLEPCDYTDENVARAMKLLDTIKADMGGTDILSPLQHVSELKAKEGFVKQIFFLTDGEVHNPDMICATAQKNRSGNRIFSIGLGSGADPGLIKGMARKSGGNYSIIGDDDNMNEKVIEMLSSAISPALKDITIQSESTQTEMWPSPCPPLFAKNPQSFIAKSNFTDNILISGSLINEQIDIVIPVSRLDDNHGLRQLFSRYIIDDYESQLLIKEDEEIKKKCIDLSLSSGVLCKYTSYIGVDYQSHEERQFAARPMISCFGGMPKDGGGGFRGMRMMCCARAAPMMAFDSLSSNVPRSACKKKKSVPREDCDDACEAITMKQSNSQEDQINSQKVDGSWTDFSGVDKDLEAKYGHVVASTVAAVAFIRKTYKDRLSEFSLVIKKALAFLKKQDKDVDWNSIINKFI